MTNPTKTLRSEMFDAHAARAERALVDLRTAAAAPALFKPEWTDRAATEYQAAIAGMKRWTA